MNRRAGILLTALCALLGLVYLLLFFRPIWDVDVFWHIRVGEWILEHLRLPDRDLFSSVDPDRSWYTFQWLYEVICHLVDSAAGLIGIRVLHTGLIWGAFALLTVQLVRRGGWLAALLGIPPLLIGFADRVRARPDAFNLLFTVLALPHILARRWTRRDLIVMAVLTLLWANIHGGGVLLLFVMLGARWLGLIMDAALQARDEETTFPWRELGREGGMLAGLFGLAALMPGFLRGVYQAFFMLGPSKEFIPEWMNTYEFIADHAVTFHEKVAAFGPLIWLGVLLAWAFLRAARNGWSFRSLPWLPILIAMPLGALALEHVRFLWLGGLIATVLAMSCFQKTGEKTSNSLIPAVGIGLVSGLLLILNLNYHTNYLGGGLARVIETTPLALEPATFPVEAADFLEETGLEGNIMNHAPWGGYLIYRTWPTCRVYTDGRGNFTWIETHVLTTIEMPGIRRDAINAAWQRAPFDIIVHPNPFPIHDQSRFDWVLVHRDADAMVYLRNSPSTAHLFERIVSWYAEQGVELPEDMRSTDVYEFERRLQRRHGARMMTRPEIASAMDALGRQIEQGDPRQQAEALFLRAKQYFRIGLFEEARRDLARFSNLNPRNPSALLMMIRCYLADGQPLEAFALSKVLVHSLNQDRSLLKRMTHDERILTTLTHSHLVEWLKTLPYNRERYRQNNQIWTRPPPFPGQE